MRHVATSICAILGATLIVVACGGTSGQPVGSSGTSGTSGTSGGTSGTSGASGGTPDASSDGPATDGGDSGATESVSLKDNRDRLLDTLAVVKSTTRCPLWKALTPTQRGVFLTITDLLGKRSYMGKSPSSGMALPHVTKVYEIRDKGTGNGGGDNNRIFLQFDTALITAMRDFKGSLPEWDESNDLAGPHSPFDATSETIDGQPTGQSQFWSADGKAKPLGRPGVETVNDPHVVEIDIDYNFIHDSNPVGDYGGKTGMELYEAKWTPLGAGGSPEFDYVPMGCTP